MATAHKFPGFDPEDFLIFRNPNRGRRREAILARLHPKLYSLGLDILHDFRSRGIEGLYPHLPQLNWPPSYEPFCTWLSISSQPHRYQDLAQLNVGIHESYVSVRLGLDTAGPTFGRFLFLMSHGNLNEVLRRIALPAGLRCRAYRRVPWPEGSRAVFDSGEDFRAGVLAAERKGANWFEVGKVFAREEHASELARPDFSATAAQNLLVLYPVFRRLAGP